MSAKLTPEEKNFNKFIKFLRTQVRAEKFSMQYSILQGLAQSNMKVTKETMHTCCTSACIFGWHRIYTAIERKLDCDIRNLQDSPVSTTGMNINDIGESMGLCRTAFYNLCYGIGYKCVTIERSLWNMSLATAIDCLIALQAWTKANTAGQSQSPFKVIAQEIIDAAAAKETPDQHNTAS